MGIGVMGMNEYMYVGTSTGTSIVYPRKASPSIPLAHPARERASERGEAYGLPPEISKTVTGWLVYFYTTPPTSGGL